MLNTKKHWIEVYPLNGKVKITNSGARVSLNKELSDYCNQIWDAENKAWKSSWIAFAESLTIYSNNDGYQQEMKAGAMPFYQVSGIVKSIEREKQFAPLIGYSNCLSIGFFTATKDGKVIFQRRDPEVHCPNVLTLEPSGYITSLAFASGAECGSEEYADNEKLFSLSTQYEYRRKAIAETFGVPSGLVSYELQQDILASGWLTKEMYFSTTGKIDVTEKDLRDSFNERIKRVEAEGSFKQADKLKKIEFFFVPFEHLKSLIDNQGELSGIDTNGYRPSDSREIPLLDECTSGLIYGYRKLTGEKLDIEETIAKLNHNGLEIKVHSPSVHPEDSPITYEFPTSF